MSWLQNQKRGSRVKGEVENFVKVAEILTCLDKY